MISALATRHRAAARIHRARWHAASRCNRMLDDSPSWWTFEIDYRVATVAVGAALLSTLLAGLPAAIRASRPSLDSLLRDGGRMGTGLAIGRIAWGLVVFEVALACLLLGLAALMTKGVLNGDARGRRRRDRRHHDGARRPDGRHVPRRRRNRSVSGRRSSQRIAGAARRQGRVRRELAARARHRRRPVSDRGPRLRRRLEASRSSIS